MVTETLLQMGRARNCTSQYTTQWAHVDTYEWRRHAVTTVTTVTTVTIITTVTTVAARAPSGRWV